MRVGRHRHVLEHQTAAETADDLGQITKVWTTAGTYRGEVRSPSGSESRRYEATVNHVIETRFPGAPFSPASRFVDVTDPADPHTYEVVASTDPDGTRRRLVTFAVEHLGVTS